MNTRYNKLGEIVYCEIDQIEAMNSLGFTFDLSPVKTEEIIKPIEKTTEKFVEKKVTPKYTKPKKDIILD